MVRSCSTWQHDARRRHAGSRSAGAGAGAGARAPPPREPLAWDYVGFYCDASDRKCHTRSGKCWAARVCEPGSEEPAAPAPRDAPARRPGAPPPRGDARGGKVFLYHMRKAGGTTLHAHLKQRCRAYDTVEWFSPDTPRARGL